MLGAGVGATANRAAGMTSSAPVGTVVAAVTAHPPGQVQHFDDSSFDWVELVGIAWLWPAV